MNVPSSAPFAGAPELQLLLLLVAGHLLADFLFQTRHMVADKARTGVLGLHVGAVAAVQGAVVLPFVSLPVVVLVLGVSLVHGFIDAVKTRWRLAFPSRLGLFLADQLLHLLVLLVGWAVLLRLAPAPSPWLPDAWLSAFVLIMMFAAAFALAWRGGSEIVIGTLAMLDSAATTDATGIRGGGQLIGVLERSLTVLLILFDQWATIALLLTAKSIARFEELKDRRFSEYYLVGTLTSLLVAILIGLALRALLR
jgi:hypothetical protein